MPLSSGRCVLVTGAGVVGLLTAGLLAGRGDRVVLVDIRVPDAPLPHGVIVETCDITDAGALRDLMASAALDAVVHTAALLSTGIRQDPVRGVAVNVLGTAHVLDAARALGVSRVVCASSTTVGYTTFARPQGPAVVEDLTLHMVSERPASIYAATKLCGEHLALLYGDLYGLDVVVLRYAAVLGGRLSQPTSVPGRLLARLVAGSGGAEKVTLDDPLLTWGGIEEFVDARDCARANVHALDAARPHQRVYNVATGAAHTLQDFVDTVRRVHPALRVALGPEPETGFAGFPHRRPAPSDVDAARRDLDFVCRHGLEDAIRHWSGVA